MFVAAICQRQPKIRLMAWKNADHRAGVVPLWPVDVATLYLGFGVSAMHRTEEGKELPESGNSDQRIDDTRKDGAGAS